MGEKQQDAEITAAFNRISELCKRAIAFDEGGAEISGILRIAERQLEVGVYDPALRPLQPGQRYDERPSRIVRTPTVFPAITQVDPDLERLLAEEEEIERQTRAFQAAQTNNQEEPTMSNNLPEGIRNHQTALVIDTRGVEGGDDQQRFADRYRRLLESVNGSNIKVDILTLADGPAKAKKVGGLVVGAPGEVNDDEDEVDTDIDLAEWASSEGYTMLLTAVFTG